MRRLCHVPDATMGLGLQNWNASGEEFEGRALKKSEVFEVLRSYAICTEISWHGRQNIKTILHSAQFDPQLFMIA